MWIGGLGEQRNSDILHALKDVGSYDVQAVA